MKDFTVYLKSGDSICLTAWSATVHQLGMLILDDGKNRIVAAFNSWEYFTTTEPK